MPIHKKIIYEVVFSQRNPLYFITKTLTMKYFYALLFTVFITASSFAQVVSIQPASAFRGVTLTTHITLASGAITLASSPQGSSDIYLQQGSNIIYTTFFDPSQVYGSFPGGATTDSL